MGFPCVCPCVFHVHSCVFLLLNYSFFKSTLVSEFCIINDCSGRSWTIVRNWGSGFCFSFIWFWHCQQCHCLKKKTWITSNYRLFIHKMSLDLRKFLQFCCWTKINNWPKTHLITSGLRVNFEPDECTFRYNYFKSIQRLACCKQSDLQQQI